MSTIKLLILDCCLAMSSEITMQWGVSCLEYCLFKRNKMIYYLESDNIQRWCQPITNKPLTGCDTWT